MIIRKMQKEDWAAVADIYQEGIDSHIATFQKQVPSYEEWDKGHIASCRLVAVEDDTVVGWVALSPYKSRCEFSGVAELSIYIKKKFYSVVIFILHGVLFSSKEMLSLDK